MIELGLPGARVVFTDRTSGDARTAEGRAALEALAGRPVAYGRQVHGAVVRRVVVARPANIAEADGQATALADIAPMVAVADCLPIALSAGTAVAMLHGGWRGLAAGIVQEGVRALRELAGDVPLAAAIGPGARGCCYEVGEEVRAALGTAGPTADLAEVATELLRAAGVESIADTGVCTIHDESFFSHRREGEAAGRQAGVAWLE